MDLVRASLKNPYLVTVLVLILLVLGTVSVTHIPTDLLPIFKAPAVQIVTLYPGMPPEVVERDMTSRLERWTGQAVGIEHQEATSMLGVSIVKDFFREDIDPNTAMSQVTSLAVSDMFYLPPGTLPPMVMPFDPTASVPLCLLAVSSETLTERKLYDVAYFEMRNRLQAIPGVIAPAVYGGKLRRILTYVDRDRLQARDLSPMDVVNAIQESNPFIPTGNMKIGDYDYFVVSNAMVPEVDELNDVPIKVEDGAPIFIKDIGEARDASQIQSNIVRINGRRQVYIPIYRQPGANTLEIVREVRSRSGRILQRLKEFDPAIQDLRMDVVMDQSEFVQGSIDSLQLSAILGAALVALVVLIFLRSIRATFLVVVTIPLAVLGAFVGLFYTGDTINAMTLGGISMAIGILVDQAIVVVENITRHARMGKSRYQAALDGAREVALPVVISTITFVVVFYPVVFLSGMAGFLFTPLALAVSFAAVTSCLLALTFIPALASRFLKVSNDDRVGILDRLGDRYRDFVGRTIRARWLVVLLALVVFGLAVVGAGQLGTELFPPVDSGQFTVLLRAPLGTNLERTEEIVKKIEKEIIDEIGHGVVDAEDTSAESDLRLVISNIGVLYDWPAAYTPNMGPMDAFLLVQLNQSRKYSAQEYAGILRGKLAKKYPGVDFAYDTGGMLTAALNFGLPSPIDIQVQGSKLEVLQEIASAIVEEARQVPGAVDVRIAQPLDYPAIKIEVDRTKASYLGLTQEEVIQNVTTAISSSVNFAPSFWISPQNGNHYLIGAQYAEEDIESFETLANVPITGRDAKRSVLLKDVARLTRTTEPAVVTHRNITRTVDVFANVVGRDVGSVAREIEERLAASDRMQEVYDNKYEKQGYRYTMRGEVSSMRESMGQFSGGLAIAAILVYLVMVAQFRSFLLPWVVILTIPLAFFGVVGLLLATGTNLGIPSFMGLILMVGIVVEYSILLVEFAVRRQREGVAMEEAILESARARFRPVVMTSLTTALALVPLAIGMGRGGEANVPLARAIIGAVIGGATLTLLVGPSLYVLIARRLNFKAADETLDIT